jgi:hypothetical protein
MELLQRDRLGHGSLRDCCAGLSAVDIRAREARELWWGRGEQSTGGNGMGELVGAV